MKKTYPTIGAGCMTLFGLPFFGFGLFMLWSLLSMLGLAIQAQTWVEVPATVLSVKLEGNKSWKAVAEYQYTYDGRVYTGDRVGLSDERDNLGSYQKRMHKRLKAAFDAEKTVPCYVDPNDPATALLDRSLRPLMVLIHLPFIFGHGLIGGGLIWWAWKHRRNETRKAQHQAKEPEKPWLWRDDWAAGEIRSSDAGLWGITIFVLLWNLISFIVASGFVFDDKKHIWWEYLLVGVFPLIGLSLAFAWVIPAWRVRLRSGPGRFRMAKVPGVIGGKLSGVAVVPDWVENAGEAWLTLTCSRTTGSGDDRKTYVSWQDKRRVIDFLDTGEPSTLGVPVDMTIPSDGTLSTDSDDGVSWSLAVEARAPRGRFNTAFEVPVYRTEESRPDIKLESTPSNEFERDLELAELLKEEGIRVEALGSADSVRYVSPPVQKWGEALAMTIGGSVFGGVAIGMLINGWWIGLAFGFFAPFFLVGAIDGWLGCSEVTIVGDRWTVRSGWYGFRGDGIRFGPSEILRIDSKKSNVQSNNTNKPSTKHLFARVKGRDKPVMLVRSICGGAATRKLLADLRTRAGHEPK